jgi:putative endonuclease
MVRTKKRETGDTGEEIAAQFLIRKGYAIIERNYLRKWGEIDIVAEKDGEVRFVEVKTLRDSGVGHRPEDMIDTRKLAKLARTAALYMEEKKDGREFQLDAVSVVLDMEKRVAHCTLLEQILEDTL